MSAQKRRVRRSSRFGVGDGVRDSLAGASLRTEDPRVRAFEEEINFVRNNCKKVRKATAHRARLNSELQRYRDKLFEKHKELEQSFREEIDAITDVLEEINSLTESGFQEVCTIEDEYERLRIDGQRTIDELQGKLEAELGELVEMEQALGAVVAKKCPPSMRRELKYHRDVLDAVKKQGVSQDAELRRMHCQRAEMDTEKSVLDEQIRSLEEELAKHGWIPNQAMEECKQVADMNPGFVTPLGACEAYHVGNKENVESPSRVTSAVKPPSSIYTPKPRSTNSPRSAGQCPPPSCPSRGRRCAANCEQEKKIFKAHRAPRFDKPFIPKRSDKPLTQPQLPKPVFWTDFRSFYRQTEFEPWLRHVQEARAASLRQLAAEAKKVEEDKLRREKNETSFRARPMPNFGHSKVVDKQTASL